MRTIKLSVGSRAVRGINKVKAKNVPPFGQHSDNRMQTTEVRLLYKTQQRALSTKCAQRQNIMRNRNEIDFKSEEENWIFMNGVVITLLYRS